MPGFGPRLNYGCSLMKAHMGKVLDLLLPKAVYVCKANRHRIKIRQLGGKNNTYH